MTDTERFLEALAGDLPESERLIMCAFFGDPNNVGPSAWRPRPWRPEREITIGERANGYVTVASFVRAIDGSFRRRTETFASGLALMVDDVGTKIPFDKMCALTGTDQGGDPLSHVDDRQGKPVMTPSAIIETSPGNFQWWYFLKTPERDMARFDGIIRAFISGALLGADPGMSGVTRVGRLPGFINGKPKYGGFRTKLQMLAPNIRYSVEELLSGFGLSINGRREHKDRLTSEEAIERNRLYAAAFKFLRQRGMLKRAEPDPSGWIEIHCPFIDDHTAKADTGAAIREPAPENGFYGGFRCHHGHCIDRGWQDLTDWIDDLAVEELEQANAAG